MRHPPGEDIFLKWKERFGPIFTFWLGETPIICIAEYNKIVEYYQRGGEAFAGRHAIGNLIRSDFMTPRGLMCTR